MDKLPFSLYDIVGYLASGVLLMATWAVVFLPNNAGDIEVSASWSIVLILVAYVIGHSISTVGDWVLGLFTRLVLKGPEVWLLKEKTPWKWIAGTDYFRPMRDSSLERLESLIAQNAKSKAKLRSYDKFLHCYYTMIMNASARERLYTFLALYGFCRNASIALIASAIILKYGEKALGREFIWEYIDTNFLTYSALICSALLFFRYLKFYRHYTTQVFMLYLERARVAESS